MLIAQAENHIIITADVAQAVVVAIVSVVVVVVVAKVKKQVNRAKV